MRKLLAVSVAVAGLCGGATLVAAQTSHTPDQAKVFVEKAAVFYKSEGRDKALPAFSDPKGAWVEGDLYIFVLDAKDGKLTTLAHGANKGLIGRSQADMKDADGKPFIQEMGDVLANADSGWTSYKWPNPATRKIAAKRTYVVKVGDVIIGAGVYEY